MIAAEYLHAIPKRHYRLRLATAWPLLDGSWDPGGAGEEQRVAGSKPQEQGKSGVGLQDDGRVGCKGDVGQSHERLDIGAAGGGGGGAMKGIA